MATRGRRTSDDGDTLILDLTGPGSHRLERERGRGDIVIAPKDGRLPPDLVVAPDAQVDFRVFDRMRTPAGSLWPRWIAYEGNDASLFDWTRKRATEDVRFAPCRDMDLDLGDAKIARLALYPRAHRLRATLPRALRELHVAGDPSRVVFSRPRGARGKLHVAGDPSRVVFSRPRGAAHELSVSFEGTPDFRLAALGDLPHLARAKIDRLSVTCEVMGRQPFDCRSLVDCRDVRSLALRGGMRHLDALARLPLESLELRFVPDLGGLPDLSAWPRLGHVIAWNVEEAGGRALKKALAGRRAAPGRMLNVSQLRSRQWFVEEHGLPFAAWTAKKARAAGKAFKTAAALLRKARTKAAARAAITGFVEAINALPGSETTEREDAGSAVEILAAVRPDLVTAKEAAKWFDAARDF
jgi:hypothetical protein